MFHKAVLFAAPAVFFAGMILKVSAWFRYTVGPEKTDLRTSRRVASALRGILQTFFSRKVLTLVRVFFLEVIFQSKVWREDTLRWFMHMCIYSGFTMLLVLHALDNLVVARFYPGYSATLNPFLFLRDAGGALVVSGIALAVYRRFIRKTRRPMTSRMDIAFMVMVGLIVLSGFSLEAAKITSHSTFQRMSEEYAGQADPEELQSLESYWVKNFGLVSPVIKGPFDNAVLEKGKSAHEINCAECHSSAKWGVLGGTPLQFSSGRPQVWLASMAMHCFHLLLRLCPAQSDMLMHRQNV
ncbi:MAG: hypothetical protein ABSG91_23190 [Syntrophobacteraceae bacterium]|jgi:nitrate reductase gamma subunit